VLAEDGFRVKLWDVAGDGRASVTVAADGDSQDLAVASTGTVAFLGQKADLLPEIWTMAPGRSPAAVTTLNKEFERSLLRAPEIIRYASSSCV
jgi:hypothetical protein